VILRGHGEKIMSDETIPRRKFLMDGPGDIDEVIAYLKEYK
jgi:hypothetical protein